MIIGIEYPLNMYNANESIQLGGWNKNEEQKQTDTETSPTDLNPELYFILRHKHSVQSNRMEGFKCGKIYNQYIIFKTSSGLRIKYKICKF